MKKTLAFVASLLLFSSASAFATGTVFPGSFNELQKQSGWKMSFLAAWNNWQMCSPSNCTSPGYYGYMKQWVKSPSLSGAATEWHLGGTKTYVDVFWNKHLVGDFSGVTDTANVLGKAHHFSYDLYFYVTNKYAPQALEFDINQFTGGRSLIFGHECRGYSAGNAWDIWDNVHNKWRSTGVPCYFKAYSWNHLTLQVERTSANNLHFVSITLNGVKHYINIYESSTATSWKGITVNQQIDGNSRQTAYSEWTDHMKLTYW